MARQLRWLSGPAQERPHKAAHNHLQLQLPGNCLQSRPVDYVNTCTHVLHKNLGKHIHFPINNIKHRFKKLSKNFSFSESSLGS